MRKFLPEAAYRAEMLPCNHPELFRACFDTVFQKTQFDQLSILSANELENMWAYPEQQGGPSFYRSMLERKPFVTPRPAEFCY